MSFSLAHWCVLIAAVLPAVFFGALATALQLGASPARVDLLSAGWR